MGAGGMRGRYLKEEVIAEGGEAGVGLVGERGLDGGEIHRRRRGRGSPAVREDRGRHGEGFVARSKEDMGQPAQSRYMGFLSLLVLLLI